MEVPKQKEEIKSMARVVSTLILRFLKILIR